jgi:ribosomal-protein-alanine N-acetyltransferase
MIAIGPAGAADATLLARLHEAAFPDDPWSERAVGEILTMPTAFARICRNGEAPLGFVLALCALPDCEIVTLGVIPTARRRGVGRRLLADLAGCARALGAAAIVLEAAEDNAAALALYRACGFGEIGRRTGYYARPGGQARAAIVLRLNLAGDGAAFQLREQT